jgi:hypothetical protein
MDWAFGVAVIAWSCGKADEEVVVAVVSPSNRRRPVTPWPASTVRTSFSVRKPSACVKVAVLHVAPSQLTEEKRELTSFPFRCAENFSGVPGMLTLTEAELSVDAVVMI